MAEFSISQKKYMEELFVDFTQNLIKTTEEVKKDFKKEIQSLKEEIHELVQNNEKKVEELEIENKSLNKRILTLERKVRKNNIVIFGLDTTSENLTQKVLELFKDILLIQLTNEDLSHIYTIGQKTEKPIIVEFISFQKKLLVTKNCYRLKNHQISISHDQCAEDLKNTKILYKYKKEAIAKGQQASIKYNGLKIDNTFYSIEELQNCQIEKEKTQEDEHLNQKSISKRTIKDIDSTENIQQDSKKIKQGLKSNQEISEPARITTRSTTQQNIK